MPVSSPRVAEMAKVFENLQAYVNIALVNEMAEVCHDLGIDVHEVIDAAMTKGHSMARWIPGPGVGGHCLPIDSVYVAWQAREQLDRPFKMAELAAEINESRPTTWWTGRCRCWRPGHRGERASVLVMGVAYKPEVGDLRESPAMPIVARAGRPRCRGDRRRPAGRELDPDPDAADRGAARRGRGPSTW